MYKCLHIRALMYLLRWSGKLQQQYQLLYGNGLTQIAQCDSTLHNIILSLAQYGFSQGYNFAPLHDSVWFPTLNRLYGSSLTNGSYTQSLTGNVLITMDYVAGPPTW
jgi:hypothetical protein